MRGDLRLRPAVAAWSRRVVLLGAAVLAAALTGFPIQSASASPPPMAVTISPTTGRSGIVASYVETYKANAALIGATIQTTLPAAWTTPQIVSSVAAGYVSVARGTCAAVAAPPGLTALAGGATRVTITGVTCVNGARLMLTYAAASAHLAGTYVFGPTTVQAGAGRPAVAIGSPSVSVAPGPTTQFAVTSRALSTVAGAAYSFTVTPEDAVGEKSTYSGTVAVSSTDHGASTVLPQPTAITGAHTFSATLTTAGPQAITVTSTASPTISGTLAGITVTPAATATLLWSALTPVGVTPAGRPPAGQALAYTLTATDHFGNVTPSYAGTVNTTSSTDPAAVVPAPYTFVPGVDRGSHAFQLTPMTAGSETYTATSTTTPTVTGTTAVAISIGVLPTPGPEGSAAVGAPFSQSFAAVGATGATTWSGTGLPAGLSIDPSTGVLSGTPQSAGQEQSYTISVTDSAPVPNTGSQTYAVGVSRGQQTIVFTSDPPASATVGSAPFQAAASANSGLPVALTIEAASASICSINGTGLVSFLADGTCTIDADQGGDADWQAAPRAQQSIDVTGVPQTIAFGSAPPSDPVVGGAAYTVQATATSGLPVTITIDATSATICTIDTTDDVTFQAAGTCTIDADQAGAAPYLPAAQVQQVIVVGKGTRTISFTSAAPTDAALAGRSLTPAASATPTGTAAAITVDQASSTVCAISPITGAVNMIGVGTCTLDANLPGDDNWNDAAEVQQSFTVGQAHMAITVDPVDNPQPVPVPDPVSGATPDYCDQQIPAAGGCPIGSLEAGYIHTFDASQSIDPPADPSNPASDAGFDPSLFTVGYHWQIYKPPGLGTARYSSNGITGYHASVLTIQPSSLPELQGTRAGTDIYWSVQLTLTVNGYTTIAFFKFIYTNSTLTLQLSTTCQLEGSNPSTQCLVAATNGLIATEPT